MSSYRELQKCAEREVAMRKNVFAKRGMNEKREREIKLMIEIADHFRDLANRQEGVDADQPALQS